MKIRLVVTGRSYQDADQVPDTLELESGATVDDALQQLNKDYLSTSPLPESCLVAVSGEHLGTIGAHESRELEAGDELLLLAPVAGG